MRRVGLFNELNHRRSTSRKIRSCNHFRTTLGMRENYNIRKLFSDTRNIFNRKLLVNLASSGPANHLVIAVFSESLLWVLRWIDDLLPRFARDIGGEIFVRDKDYLVGV